MPLRVEHRVPLLSDFTPLADHEAETPQTFFDGRPVLHAARDDCIIIAPQASLDSCALLRRWFEQQYRDAAVNGSAMSHHVFAKADARILIASSALILVSAGSAPQGTNASTMHLPYDAINLHATQQYNTDAVPDEFRNVSGPNAIYLQLDADVPSTDTGDLATVELYIIMRSTQHQTAAENVKFAFDAISTCANAWSAQMDSDSDGEAGQNGDVVFPELTESGWITDADVSENEYQAETTPGEVILGPGAGTRRARGVNDDNEIAEDDPTKWQRQ